MSQTDATPNAEPQTLLRTDVSGTLDELEPLLRDRGFVAVLTMAGPMDLATFDPYGMRRVGSVNIQSERWADHVFRGTLAFCGEQAYIAGREPDARSPFVCGLFPLLKVGEL